MPCSMPGRNSANLAARCWCGRWLPYRNACSTKSGRPPARYEKLLATSPEVFHHAPLKYIASYLGVTDSSLSRIRSNT
jgi:hypothetical protein